MEAFGHKSSLTGVGSLRGSKGGGEVDDADVGIDYDFWLPVYSAEFYNYVMISLFLVLFGGIMSGLQQGITKISLADLLVAEAEAKNSSRIKLAFVSMLRELVRRRHLTLVTLLFANAVAMEALPIFLDVLVPSYVAIILSVTLLVIFGEIIPQAVTLRWPKEVSLVFAGLVWCLVIVLFPLTYPVARVLDYFLGREEYKLLSRHNLRNLILLHSCENDGPLSLDEVDVVTGALELSQKTANDVVVPLSSVFMISNDDVLDEDKLSTILNAGHSRIPVFKGHRGNVVGVLLTRNLARIDPKNKIAVRTLQVLPLWTVRPGLALFTIMRQFRTAGVSHMAVVSEFNAPQSLHVNQEAEMVVTSRQQEELNAVGILTLEDIIEELLKGDILDEIDSWENAKLSLESRVNQVRNLRASLINILDADIKRFEEQKNVRLYKGLNHNGSFRSLEEEPLVKTQSGQQYQSFGHVA